MSLLFKRIKLFTFIVTSLFMMMMIVIYLFRRPSYTIETSGTLYIVNKLSKDITVFDLQKGKEIATIPIKMQAYQATTLTGLPKIAVANYYGNKIKEKHITIINTNTNTIEKTLKFSEGQIGLDGIVALPDLNKVGVINHITNDFLIINIDSERIETKIAMQQMMSHFFVLHPFKPIAYVSNMNSGTVSVLDLKSNQLIEIIRCGTAATDIALTPDGSELWVTNKIDDVINIINTETNEVVNTIKSGKEPLSLKFSTDGNYCLVANASDGTVSVYNPESRIKVKTIKIPGKKGFLERLLYHTPRPVTILMHPNSKYAFVSNSNANKIEVIDMEKLILISTIETGQIPDGLAFI